MPSPQESSYSGDHVTEDNKTPIVTTTKEHNDATRNNARNAQKMSISIPQNRHCNDAAADDISNVKSAPLPSEYLHNNHQQLVSSSHNEKQSSGATSISTKSNRTRRRHHHHHRDSSLSEDEISRDTPEDTDSNISSGASSLYSDTSSDASSIDYDQGALASPAFPPLDSAFMLREELGNVDAFEAARHKRRTSSSKRRRRKEREQHRNEKSPLSSPTSSTYSNTSSVLSEDDYEDYFSLPSIEPLTPFDSKLFKTLEKELRSYKDKGTGIIRKLKHVSQKQRSKIQKRRQRFQKRMRDPNFVKTKDKLAFTGGVINVILTTVIASRFPSLLPWWFLLWSGILLGIRFYLYHSQHFHYFMLDFCYLANLLFLFYLFCYPTSPHLFILNMTNANGPLLWAVVMWRNSLVFHDLDKITSTFIHCLPVTVSFVVRWVPEAGDHAVCLNPECSVSFMDIIVPHMIFFVFWEICYYLKTEVIDKDILEADERLITSFRYLKKSAEAKKTKSIGYRFVTALGPEYQVFMFMVTQGMYHLTTILLVKFMYEYMYFHLLTIAFVFGTCIWNGSTFYIVKFSVAYQQRMAQLEEDYKLHREEYSSGRRHHSSSSAPIEEKA